MRNDRHSSFVIGHLPRVRNGEREPARGGQARERGARKLPKRHTAADGRETSLPHRGGINPRHAMPRARPLHVNEPLRLAQYAPAPNPIDLPKPEA